MICPKCNANVNPGEIFCSFCGKEMPKNFSQQYFSNNYDEDEALIDAYIGANANKIKNQRFSACTFFLNFYYLMYRKLRVYSILWCVIALIFSISIVGLMLVNMPVALLYSGIVSMLAIGINIFISFKFKDIYLKNVKANIKRIKFENPSATQGELINICKSKGGTSILPSIILLVVVTIINSFISFFSSMLIFQEMDSVFKTLYNPEKLEQLFEKNELSINKKGNEVLEITDEKGNEVLEFIDEKEDDDDYFGDPIKDKNFPSYFSSVPKPDVDSTWRENVGMELSEFDENIYTMGMYFFTNSASEEVKSEFEEYKKLLERNGFSFIEEELGYYVYTKNDIEVTTFFEDDTIYVNVVSGVSEFYN